MRAAVHGMEKPVANQLQEIANQNVARDSPYSGLAESGTAPGMAVQRGGPFLL